MLSKRALSINPSSTLAITARAKQMKKEGIDIVSLAAGEPDFDTPENIKKAAIKAIESGFTKYTPTSGIPELKKAICEKLKKDNNLDYQLENILVSAGAKQCIYNIIQVLIDPGQEVLIPVPYWVSYPEIVKLAGGKSVFLPTTNFKVSEKTLKKAITKKTKVFILNSPSNPTGAVYNKQELNIIAKICKKHSIYIISDEIYEPLSYGKKHLSIASLDQEIKKLTIVVNGVSKTYSMTGWRIGYCAAEKEIIKRAVSIQDHSTSCPNSIAQKAALEALKGPQEVILKMKQAYQKRRDYMITRLKEIKQITAVLPDGAFYVFADISKLYHPKIPNSVEFCRQLLEKNHVATIPGDAFGDDNYIRLSYATSKENIEKALNRIKDFVQTFPVK